MKTIIKSLLMMGLVCGFVMLATAQTPLYTNTSSTTTVTSPFSSTNYKTQYLFAPEQFTGAPTGYITAIYVKSSGNAILNTFIKFTVKMGHTTLSAMTTAWVTDLQSCLYLDTARINYVASGKWVRIALQTPFAFDPTKYLVIEISNSGRTGGFNIYHNTQTYNSRCYGSVTAATPAVDKRQPFMGIDIAPSRDAGVFMIDKPSTIYYSGSYPIFYKDMDTVKCSVLNWGTDTLKSVSLKWSVDGVEQTSPADWSGAKPLLSSTGILSLGAYNFSNGLHRIKAWTANPNNGTDLNIQNDTAFLNAIKCTAYQGEYTIGPSGCDFTSISAALTDLYTCGVVGPVTFKLKKGTYSGRIVINSIPGTSSTNRVTFDGQHPDSVKITYAAVDPARATLAFFGADYITFKNMTIENTGTSSGYGIYLKNLADYNTFDNCRVLVDTVSTAMNFGGIIAASSETDMYSNSSLGQNANYITINNCFIKGGYNGVAMHGYTDIFNSSSPIYRSTGNSITNSTITKCRSTAISGHYLANIIIKNNLIRDVGFGIMLYYAGSNLEICKNSIYMMINSGYAISLYYHLLNSVIKDNYISGGAIGIGITQGSASHIENNYIRTAQTGISFNGENYSGNYYTSTDTSTIYNNMISKGGHTNLTLQGNGIIISGSNRANIYHNTVQIDTPYTSTIKNLAAIRMQTGTGGIRIKNNIFRIYASGFSCFSTDGANISAGDIDYNDYYVATTGLPVAYWGAGSACSTCYYSTLSDWQTAFPGQNANSMSVDPQTISKYNQHIQTSSPFLQGTKVCVSKDYDYDARCIDYPTIGADEFNLIVDAGEIGSDQTLCSGSIPESFSEVTAASGNGTLSYQWQISTTDCSSGFSDIDGATSETWAETENLTQTTFYRRIVTVSSNSRTNADTSNCIAVYINDVTAGVIASDQAVCYGGDPEAFIVSTEATGSGELTYQWQYNSTGCNDEFTDISGATSEAYDIPEGITLTTYYRRKVTSTLNSVTCSKYSNCITVTVHSLPTCSITVTPSGNTYTGGVATDIYLGYGPQSITLTASGGTSYSWSPASGLDNAGIAAPVFAPTVEGTYVFTVTVTDNNGCQKNCQVTINVIDVRGGNNNMVYICHNGNTLCMSNNAINTHLSNHTGDYLGRCRSRNIDDNRPKYSLEVYPNPFYQSAFIEFSTATDGRTVVELFNIYGQKQQVLFDQDIEAGIQYETSFDAINLESGIYFIKMNHEGNELQKKVVLLK